MLSAAVSSGMSWPNWKTNPKAVRRSTVRFLSLTSSIRRPSNHTSPRSGLKVPARQCSSVDLPEPLGPITARISPSATDRLAPRRAGVWPKDKYRSRASMRASEMTASECLVGVMRSIVAGMIMRDHREDPWYYP